jgi:hypothetical protein
MMRLFGYSPINYLALIVYGVIYLAMGHTAGRIVGGVVVVVFGVPVAFSLRKRFGARASRKPENLLTEGEPSVSLSETWQDCGKLPRRRPTLRDSKWAGVDSESSSYVGQE